MTSVRGFSKPLVISSNTPAQSPVKYYRSVICPGMIFRSRVQFAVPSDEMVQRTPEQHRAAVEAWRAKASKQDHQVFGRATKTDSARHRNLAELSSLLAMRGRPIGVAEGVPDGPTPEIGTNWRTMPANDNHAPDEGFAVERALEYEPSLDMIESQIENLPVRTRSEPMVLGGRAAREIHAIPLDGDVEYGTYVDDDGKAHRVIVRIGRIRFSDGTQTEKGQKLVFDQVVDADIPMPVGAMLSGREKSSRDKGAEVDDTGSNSHYRWIIGKVRSASPAKPRPKKVDRVVITKAAARLVLADAISNTPVLPETTVCPDGLPYGPTNLRQLFIGGRKGKKGETGSQAWQDIFTEKENRETFTRALDAMQDEHVRVLTEAMTAHSLGQLGEVRGYRGRHAIDAGRRLLRAANDNFEEAMHLATYAAEG
jgi:hypothetical protein